MSIFRLVQKRNFKAFLLLIWFCSLFYLLVVYKVRNVWNFQMSPALKKYKFDRIVYEPSGLSKSPFLLMLVNSTPNKKGRKVRNAIRETWGNCNSFSKEHYSNFPMHNGSCGLVFFLAMSYSENDALIEEEARQHNDILIVDYLDSYVNITRKLLVAFKWAKQLKPKYILKTDDDIVVYTPGVINTLSRKTEEYFYGGVIWEHGDVQRKPSDRHYVPKELYPFAYFPSFCKGSCYIFSGNLLKPLINVANFIPWFGVDDAYVGVLMYHIGVSPVEISDIVIVSSRLLLYVLQIGLDCSFKNLIALGHSLNGNMIKTFHKRFLKVTHGENTSSSCRFLI